MVRQYYGVHVIHLTCHEPLIQLTRFNEYRWRVAHFSCAYRCYAKTIVNVYRKIDPGLSILYSNCNDEPLPTSSAVYPVRSVRVA